MTKSKPKKQTKLPIATRVHTAIPINADSVGALYFALPQELEAFQTAVDAGKYRGIVWDMDQELRNDAKHGSGANQKYAQLWRDKLWELMEDEGVDL